MKRKIISLMLCCVMIISCIPGMTFAADNAAADSGNAQVTTKSGETDSAEKVITEETAIKLARPYAVEKYSSYDGVDKGEILDQNGEAYLVSFGISDEESGFCAIYRVGKLDGAVSLVTEAQDYFSGMIDISAGKVNENPQRVDITKEKAIELARPSAVTKYSSYDGVEEGEIIDQNDDAYLVSFGISDEESGFCAIYRVDKFDGTVRFVTEAQDYWEGMIDISAGKVSDSNNGQAGTDEPVPTEKNSFKDVPETAWYAEAVNYVSSNNLMNGVSDTEFNPLGTATRSMVVTVLYRIEGSPETDGVSSFSDVKKDSWYSKAISWAAKNKIVTGKTETVFAPNDNITREQLASILYRYAEMKGKGFKGAFMFNLSYTDKDKISSYAITPVMWCTTNGIMTGKSENQFAPKDNASRAEIAAILMRMNEKIGTGDNTGANNDENNSITKLSYIGEQNIEFADRQLKS